MSTKLRSFAYSVYTHKRSHFDDPEVPAGRFVPPDLWLELRGAVLLPQDPAWWDGQVELPNWDRGAFYADAKGHEIRGTSMGGRPMKLLIDAWAEGRRMADGVLILSPVEEERPRR